MAFRLIEREGKAVTVAPSTEIPPPTATGRFRLVERNGQPIARQPSEVEPRQIAGQLSSALLTPLLRPTALDEGLKSELLRLGQASQRIPTFQSIAPAVGATARRPLELLRLPTGLTTGFAPGTTLGRVTRGVEQQAQDITAAAAADLLATEAATNVLGTGIGLAVRPVRPTKVPLTPETQARVEQVVSALKQAKPIRAEQQALHRQARSVQLARIMRVRGELGGEAGLRAELGQLKGELPKAQFESLRTTITQPTIDALMDDLNVSPHLGPWEALNAKIGLAKLFGPQGGQVPTLNELSLLRKAFGSQLAGELLKKRPLLRRFTGELVELANLPRAILTTADLSAPLQQGLFLIGRPKQWIPAFTKMFKYFASEKAFQSLQTNITQRPTFTKMQDARLSLTDIGETFTGREEAFLSRLAERAPGGRIVRASNRAYVGFLNKLRADVFDDLLKKGQALGVADDPAFLERLGSFINAATGRGSLGLFERSATAMSTIFFSPRLISSRLTLFNPAFYITQHPLVRKEALKSLMTFAGTGLSILGLAKLAGAEVGSDPRNANFGKIKIGNTRYDLWGGFQQYIVAASRLITGKYISSVTGRELTLGEGYRPLTRKDIAVRLLEQKVSPPISFALSFLEGRSPTGEPFRTLPEVADRFIPMVLQDMYDLSREQGPTLGLPMAFPAIFGVGVQTYGRKLPQLTTTPSGAEKISFRQLPSLGETIVNALTGTQVSNIPTELHEPLERARQAEATRQARVDEAKRLTLQDGRTRIVEGTKVFLKRGVVHSKRLGKGQTPQRIFEQAIRRKLRR